MRSDVLAFPTHANPVQPRRRFQRPIRLHCDLEAAGVQRVDQGRVHLQQRLPAWQYHRAPTGAWCLPADSDGFGQVVAANLPPPVPTKFVSQDRLP